MPHPAHLFAQQYGSSTPQAVHVAGQQPAGAIAPGSRGQPAPGAPGSGQAPPANPGTGMPPWMAGPAEASMPGFSRPQTGFNGQDFGSPAGPMNIHNIRARTAGLGGGFPPQLGGLGQQMGPMRGAGGPASPGIVATPNAPSPMGAPTLGQPPAAVGDRSMQTGAYIAQEQPQPMGTQVPQTGNAMAAMAQQAAEALMGAPGGGMPMQAPGGGTDMTGFAPTPEQQQAAQMAQQRDAAMAAFKASQLQGQPGAAPIPTNRFDPSAQMGRPGAPAPGGLDARGTQGADPRERARQAALAPMGRQGPGRPELLGAGTGGRTGQALDQITQLIGAHIRFIDRTESDLDPSSEPRAERVPRGDPSRAGCAG